MLLLQLFEIHVANMLTMIIKHADVKIVMFTMFTILVLCDSMLPFTDQH